MNDDWKLLARAVAAIPALKYRQVRKFVDCTLPLIRIVKSTVILGRSVDTLDNTNFGIGLKGAKDLVAWNHPVVGEKNVVRLLHIPDYGVSLRDEKTFESFQKIKTATVGLKFNGDADFQTPRSANKGS